MPGAAGRVNVSDARSRIAELQPLRDRIVRSPQPSIATESPICEPSAIIVHGRDDVIISVRIPAALMALAVLYSPAAAQPLAATAEQQAAIETHPHVRQLTTFGSRPDWSPDGKRLLFVSKEYGDVYEIELATGNIRPITIHFPHKGFFRAYYLANGDFLLTGARDFSIAAPAYSRHYDSEMWVLKADLSGPPVPLDARNSEGVAVSRREMRIAFAEPQGERPPVKPDAELFSGDMRKGTPPKIYSAQIVYENGVPRLAERLLLLDCGDRASPVARVFAAQGLTCGSIEPQNFVPPSDAALVGMVISIPSDPARPIGFADIRITPFRLDISDGTLVPLADPGQYFEPEGIFPDGSHVLVEHDDGPLSFERLGTLDLWKLALDGSGRKVPVTRFNALHPELKSNQGVISPDGRWMAFGVSTAAIERRVAGQGTGLFLFDLAAAGLAEPPADAD